MSSRSWVEKTPNLQKSNQRRISRCHIHLSLPLSTIERINWNSRRTSYFLTLEAEKSPSSTSQQDLRRFTLLRVLILQSRIQKTCWHLQQPSAPTVLGTRTDACRTETNSKVIRSDLNKVDSCHRLTLIRWTKSSTSFRNSLQERWDVISLRPKWSTSERLPNLKRKKYSNLSAQWTTSPKHLTLRKVQQQLKVCNRWTLHLTAHSRAIPEIQMILNHCSTRPLRTRSFAQSINVLPREATRRLPSEPHSNGQKKQCLLNLSEQALLASPMILTWLIDLSILTGSTKLMRRRSKLSTTISQSQNEDSPLAQRNVSRW